MARGLLCKDLVCGGIVGNGLGYQVFSPIYSLFQVNHVSKQLACEP